MMEGISLLQQSQMMMLGSLDQKRQAWLGAKVGNNMRHVCMNRLKSETMALHSLVDSLERQESTMQELFECIFKLFEHELLGSNQNEFESPPFTTDSSNLQQYPYPSPLNNQLNNQMNNAKQIEVQSSEEEFVDSSVQQTELMSVAEHGYLIPSFGQSHKSNSALDYNQNMQLNSSSTAQQDPKNESQKPSYESKQIVGVTDSSDAAVQQSSQLVQNQRHEGTPSLSHLIKQDTAATTQPNKNASPEDQDHQKGGPISDKIPDKKGLQKKPTPTFAETVSNQRFCVSQRALIQKSKLKTLGTASQMIETNYDHQRGRVGTLSEAYGGGMDSDIREEESFEQGLESHGTTLRSSETQKLKVQLRNWDPNSAFGNQEADIQDFQPKIIDNANVEDQDFKTSFSKQVEEVPEDRGDNSQQNYQFLGTFQQVPNQAPTPQVLKQKLDSQKRQTRKNSNLSELTNRRNKNFGRSLKESIKVVVQLLVEDIWAHFESFQFQRQVLRQSAEMYPKDQQIAERAIGMKSARKSNKMSKKIAQRQINTQKDTKVRFSHEREIDEQESNVGDKNNNYLKLDKDVSEAVQMLRQDQSRQSISKYSASQQCPIESKMPLFQDVKRKGSLQSSKSYSSERSNKSSSSDQKSNLQNIALSEAPWKNTDDQEIMLRQKNNEFKCSEQSDVRRQELIPSVYTMNFIDPQTQNSQNNLVEENRGLADEIKPVFGGGSNFRTQDRNNINNTSKDIQKDEQITNNAASSSNRKETQFNMLVRLSQSERTLNPQALAQQVQFADRHLHKMAHLAARNDEQNQNFTQKSQAISSELTSNCEFGGEDGAMIPEKLTDCSIDFAPMREKRHLLNKKLNPALAISAQQSPLNKLKLDSLDFQLLQDNKGGKQKQTQSQMGIFYNDQQNGTRSPSIASPADPDHLSENRGDEVLVGEFSPKDVIRNPQMLSQEQVQLLLQNVQAVERNFPKQLNTKIETIVEVKETEGEGSGTNQQRQSNRRNSGNNPSQDPQSSEVSTPHLRLRTSSQMQNDEAPTSTDPQSKPLFSPANELQNPQNQNFINERDESPEKENLENSNNLQVVEASEDANFEYVDMEQAYRAGQAHLPSNKSNVQGRFIDGFTTSSEDTVSIMFEEVTYDIKELAVANENGYLSTGMFQKQKGGPQVGVIKSKQQYPRLQQFIGKEAQERNSVDHLAGIVGSERTSQQVQRVAVQEAEYCSRSTEFAALKQNANFFNNQPADLYLGQENGAVKDAQNGNYQPDQGQINNFGTNQSRQSLENGAINSQQNLLPQSNNAMMSNTFGRISPRHASTRNLIPKNGYLITKVPPPAKNSFTPQKNKAEHQQEPTSQLEFTEEEESATAHKTTVRSNIQRDYQAKVEVVGNAAESSRNGRNTGVWINLHSDTDQSASLEEIIQADQIGQPVILNSSQRQTEQMSFASKEQPQHLQLSGSKSNTTPISNYENGQQPGHNHYHNIETEQYVQEYALPNPNQTIEEEETKKSGVQKKAIKSGQTSDQQQKPVLYSFRNKQARSPQPVQVQSSSAGGTPKNEFSDSSPSPSPTHTTTSNNALTTSSGVRDRQISRISTTPTQNNSKQFNNMGGGYARKFNQIKENQAKSVTKPMISARYATGNSAGKQTTNSKKVAGGLNKSRQV